MAKFIFIVFNLFMTWGLYYPSATLCKTYSVIYYMALIVLIVILEKEKE